MTLHNYGRDFCNSSIINNTFPTSPNHWRLIYSHGISLFPPFLHSLISFLGILMATQISDNTSTNQFSPVKLSSSTFLIWGNHMTLLMALHKLSAHIDGSSPPSETVTTSDRKTEPNPNYATWLFADQKAALLLLSSLTEEAATEVLGITGARQIWITFENTYSNASIERVQSLRDSLQQLTKGTSSVTDFSRKFKLLCEQLPAIGHPVAETDKLHWFLLGLGPSYESFSIIIRNIKPAPLFRDLVAQVESHELFTQNLHGTTTPPAAFHVQGKRDSSLQSRSLSSYRGSSSRGRGRSKNNRQPRCQLCRTYGHYASACPDLRSYATQSPALDDSLVKAFHAKCHVTEDTPDWTGDTRATDYMTPTPDCLHYSTPYKRKHAVIFGNGSENKTGTCSREMR
ncbi:putative RNA-directed DNA polymerase [Helianthus annuus]|nr:putative RNA-directed DNA polymerase [Helianthus annuus]